MPRPRTGRLRIKQTSRGRSFAVRFKAAGREHFVQLGGEWEGWTEDQAHAQMKVLMGSVDNGQWTPPPSKAAPAAEPESTFQVFASIWLDLRQRRLAAKTVAQVRVGARAPARRLRNRPSQITAVRIDAKLRERDAIVAADARGRPVYENSQRPSSATPAAIRSLR